MNNVFVNIENLSIGYFNKKGTLIYVLKNVSLQIKPGETLGLVGESGCGKSTLGQAMMGYLRSGSRVLNGSIHFSGQDMFALSVHQLESIRGNKIALIPQNAGKSLTPTMRVGTQIIEAIRLNADISRDLAKRQMLDLLSKVRLPNPEVMSERYPHELSGGQQQRVAIARALANNPSIILADEPTGNLDSESGQQVMKLLSSINKEGKTILLVTHDSSLKKYTNKVINMLDGEIVG
jgi:peptide/nickel transport system ATP-binding protein